jgi:hypothetical protein
MKTHLAATIASLSALALAASSPAFSASFDGGIIAVRPVEAVAVVVESDAAARTLTINDPAGKRITFDVPPEIPLETIRPGTLLDVSYVEGQALTILKAGSVPTAIVQSVAVAPRPGRPVGLSVRPHRVLGQIRDIDRDKRALTIVGADRLPVALNVAPIVEGFDQLKPGDSAAIEYTGAIVLSAVAHDGGKPGAPRL